MKNLFNKSSFVKLPKLDKNVYKQDITTSKMSNSMNISNYKMPILGYFN